MNDKKLLLWTARNEILGLKAALSGWVLAAGTVGLLVGIGIISAVVHLMDDNWAGAIRPALSACILGCLIYAFICRYRANVRSISKGLQMYAPLYEEVQGRSWPADRAVEVDTSALKISWVEAEGSKVLDVHADTITAEPKRTVWTGTVKLMPPGDG